MRRVAAGKQAGKQAGKRNMVLAGDGGQLARSLAVILEGLNLARGCSRLLMLPLLLLLLMPASTCATPPKVLPPPPVAACLLLPR